MFGSSFTTYVFHLDCFLTLFQKFHYTTSFLFLSSLVSLNAKVSLYGTFWYYRFLMIQLPHIKPQGSYFGMGIFFFLISGTNFKVNIIQDKSNSFPREVCSLGFYKQSFYAQLSRKPWNSFFLANFQDLLVLHHRQRFTQKMTHNAYPVNYISFIFFISKCIS